MNRIDGASSDKNGQLPKEGSGLGGGRSKKALIKQREEKAKAADFPAC